MVSILASYLVGPSSDYLFREWLFCMYAVHLLLYCSKKYTSGIEVHSVFFLLSEGRTVV
jgi:hypothetical protein